MPFAILTVLLACKGGSIHGPGDTDTTGDTEVPEDLAACPDFSGLQTEGTVTAWQSTQAWADANNAYNVWTTEVRSIDKTDTESTVSVVSEGTSDVPGTDSVTFTITLEMRCDADGVWMSENDTDYEFVIFGVASEGYLYFHYDDPDHVLVRHARADDTWTVHATGTVEDSRNGNSGFSHTIVRTISGPTSTTVPAGTYDTLQIDGELTDENGTTSTTSWVEPDIGLVLTDLGELTGFTPG